MKEIFDINDLDKLKAYLQKKDIEPFREQLFALFLQYVDYKNADDWNKAVRICECLAIIGWGKNEPVEAVKSVFFNGNPQTAFRNKSGEYRFVDAIWSQRKDGLTMEQGRTSYHYSPHLKDKPALLWDYPVEENILNAKLEKQRNWITKNPILITRGISNCYESTKPVIESIENDLQKQLDRKMQPEKYGNAINRIIINHSHSYYDHAHCKSNYIISENEKKLTNQKAREELHKMFSEEEIQEHGYYLRNRFNYGPFKKETGKVNIDIHFEKAFSELGYKEQKGKFISYVGIALNTIINNLKKKKLDYDFELMMNDFEAIAEKWKNTF